MSDMQANVTISLKDEISSRLGTIGSAVETLSNKLTAFKRNAGNVFTSLGSSASALSTASASLTTAGSRAAAAAASFRSLNASAGSIRTLSSSLATLPRALRDMASQMPSVVRHGNSIVRSLQGFSRDLPRFLRSSRSVRDILGAVADKLRDAANQANLLRGSVSALDGAVSSSNSQLVTLRGTLSGVESSLSSSATSAASLSASLGTIQRAAAASRAEAQSLSDAFENLGGLSISLGKGFLAAGGGIAGAGLYAVKKAMEVETSEAALKNTLTGGEAESAQQLQALYREAQKLGVELPGSTKDMMEMFVALRQQGISVKNILGNGEGGLGKATATFATLCGRDFQTSAVYVAKFQEALGVSAAKTTEMIGKLNQLRNASGLTEDQLFETMKYVGPSLSALKVTGPGKEYAIDEIFSFFGILAKKGIEGSSAGTGTAQMLMRLSKINEIINSDKFKYADLIAKHKIRFTLFDRKGEFIGLTNAIAQFADLKNKLNDQQVMNLTNALLGDEAGRVMMAAMQEDVPGMHAMQREIMGQKGMDESIKNIMSTGAMKWETLQGGIETSISTIGKKISEHIKLDELFDKAIDKLDKLNEWLNDPKNDKKIKQWIEDAKTLAVTLVGIGTTLVGIGSALTSMVAVTKTIGAVGESFGAIKNSMGPTGSLFKALSKIKGILPSISSLLTTQISCWGGLAGATAGVFGLALAIGLIYKYSDKIKRLLKGFWQGVTGENSASYFSQSLATIKENLQPVTDSFKELLDFFRPLLDCIKEFFAPVQGDEADTLGGMLLGEFFVYTLGKLAEGVAYLISIPFRLNKAWRNALSHIFSAIWYVFGGGLISDLLNDPQGLMNRIKSAFIDLLDWLKDMGKLIALTILESFNIPLPAWLQRFYDERQFNQPMQQAYAVRKTVQSFSDYTDKNKIVRNYNNSSRVTNDRRVTNQNTYNINYSDPNVNAEELAKFLNDSLYSDSVPQQGMDFGYDQSGKEPSAVSTPRYYMPGMMVTV